MPRTLDVQVHARIPFSGKVRKRVALWAARLGLLAVTSRLVRRLPYDWKIGNGRWRRRYVYMERN